MPRPSRTLDALAALWRLARVHELAYTPRGRSPSDVGRVGGSSGDPLPIPGDAGAVMDWRHACRDVAVAYSRLADAVDELRAADGRGRAPRLDVRDVLELVPDPPLDAADERAAVDRAAVRHPDRMVLSWRDGARARPAASLSTSELRQLLHGIAAATALLDRDDVDGDAAVAAQAAAAAAGQLLDRAERRLRRAAGPNVKPDEPPPRCANEPCPNGKRTRGVECHACARYRQRRGAARPIRTDEQDR